MVRVGYFTLRYGKEGRESPKIQSFGISMIDATTSQIRRLLDGGKTLETILLPTWSWQIQGLHNQIKYLFAHSHSKKVAQYFETIRKQKVIRIITLQKINVFTLRNSYKSLTIIEIWGWLPRWFIVALPFDKIVLLTLVLIHCYINYPLNITLLLVLNIDSWLINTYSAWLQKFIQRRSTCVHKSAMLVVIRAHVFTSSGSA